MVGALHGRCWGHIVLLGRSEIRLGTDRGGAIPYWVQPIGWLQSQPEDAGIRGQRPPVWIQRPAWATAQWTQEQLLTDAEARILSAGEIDFSQLQSKNCARFWIRRCLRGMTGPEFCGIRSFSLLCNGFYYAAFWQPGCCPGGEQERDCWLLFTLYLRADPWHRSRWRALPLLDDTHALLLDRGHGRGQVRINRSVASKRAASISIFQGNGMDSFSFVLQRVCLRRRAQIFVVHEYRSGLFSFRVPTLLKRAHIHPVLVA